MPKNNKAALKEQIPFYLAELALTAAMLGVYALLGRLTEAVILGALVGTLLAIGNHIFMLISLLRVLQSEDPQRGQLKMQGNYILRMLGLALILVLVLKFTEADPIATVLPMALMRIALFLSGLLIRRKGEETK